MTGPSKRLEAQERQKRYEAGRSGGSLNIKDLEKKIDQLQQNLKDLDLYLSKPESAKEPQFYEQIKKRGEIQHQLTQTEESYLQVLEQKESVNGS